MAARLSCKGAGGHALGMAAKAVYLLDEGREEELAQGAILPLLAPAAHNS